MAINKDKKVEISSRLKDEVLKAQGSIVFVNFHGLPMAQTTALRSDLAKDQVKLFVAKKTLIKRAFAEAGIPGVMPELPGEIAVAYGDDLLTPAKGVYALQKKSPEMIKIVGGVFEGSLVDAAKMTMIAEIPPREVLLAQFLNVINSPIAGFVMALDQIAKKQEAVA